jgi:iron complex transport system substrate-binding protein
MSKYLWVLAPIVLLTLAAVACEEDEEEGTPTATGTATPTAAAPATPAATPTPGAGVAYPITVTDMMDRSVTIEAAPQRIVATSPTTLEILYAVGGTAVARESTSDYPPEAEGLPEVGGAYRLDFETIVAQNPDLLIADAVNQPRFVSQFEALGIPALMVGAESFEDVVDGMRLLGQVLGLSDEAQVAVADLEDERDALLAKVPDEDVTVLIVIGDEERNIYAAKPESYVGSLAQMLGAANPTEGLPDSGPYPGYTLYSPEQVVQIDPDVVLTLSPAPPPVPPLSEMLPSVPGYSSLDAVNEGRLHEIDVKLFLHAPGPRVVEALQEMAQLLYPDMQ